MVGKKKESATVPQKWEEVPEIPKEEQPYPLPEGWKWVKLIGGFAECLDSYRKPVNASEREKRQGNIPYYGATGQVGWIDDYLTNENLVLVGEDGAPFLDPIKDKAYIIDGKAWVNNHAHILRSFYGKDGNLFLMHYLNQFNYKNYVNGTTRLKLTQSSLQNFSIPLPPPATITKIVTHIEFLFSQLDEAAEKVQTVSDSYEARKQAILFKAFSGELTQNVEIIEDENYKNISEIPKEEHPYPLPQGWKWVQGKTIFCMGGNTSPTGEIFEYIDIDSIDNSRQLIKASKRLSVKDAPSRAKRNLKNGDTIFSMVRPYLKNIAYIDEKFSTCIASTGFYVCRPNEYVDSRYLFLLMTSDYVVNGLNKFMRGDNSPSIKPYHIENFAYPLPPKKVQKYITKYLDIFCIKLYKSKSIIDILLKNINQLRISILQESFTGNFSIN